MSLRVGLPRMVEHLGERRDFLPAFVRELGRIGADELLLEEGYGAGMGIPMVEYLAQPGVRVVEPGVCLGADVVLALRCPGPERLSLLRPGAVLVSMLHYPTRAGRNDRLRSMGVRAVSLDAVVDDHGGRQIENLALTAWAGVGEAFRALGMSWGWFAVPSRQPIRVTVLGSGALGGHAVHAATRYGDVDLRAALHRAGTPGVEVAVVDHDLAWHEDYMRHRLEMTDILVDATRRPDPTACVVPNGWIAWLPEHAVLLDLAADPYDLGVDPPGVKAIQGIPHGSLAQHVFAPDDPAWDTIDPRVAHTAHRWTLSCDAWPGLRPRESMARYGEQLEDVMEVMLTVPSGTWRVDSPHARVRAVARAELERWRAHAA